jgi:hypothetical protein
LVDKLVEKDVLTLGEGQAVRVEASEEKRKELAKRESIPEWIRNTKFKGDLRLRYQGEGTEKDDKLLRHRGRVRFRLGLAAKVNDKFKLAAGLATGSDDPRSTNQTMENTFDTPDIRLDYACAEFAPTDWVTVKGGKINGIKNLIFRPSDLLWDSDINPEGASILLGKKVDSADLFINTGLWILNEDKADESDPFIWVVQPGVKYKLGGKAHVKLAVAYYGFHSVQGTTLEHSGESNTLENDVLKYKYDSVSPSLELGIKESLPFLPYLAVFGDYVNNPDPEEKNQGYLGGTKFGSEKVKGWGDWQIKYMYRHLEKDAWLDTFPDSDSLGGETNVEGHEVVLDCGLAKNTSLALDYYGMEMIKDSDGRNHLIQVDLLWKF